MLVLDGLAILVAHVAEDVLPSLGDLLCHHTIINVSQLSATVSQVIEVNGLSN